jgi:hypothetical protein
MPHMRVHCLCYGLLSPIWSIVDILRLPLASCFLPKPLGPMSASTASFSGLSSDSILLFRPYLGILPSLTFSSLLFISYCYSLDAVAATSTIHCVFSLRSVRLPGVWDINHTLLLLSTVSSRLYNMCDFSIPSHQMLLMSLTPIYYSDWTLLIWSLSRVSGTSNRTTYILSTDEDNDKIAHVFKRTTWTFTTLSTASCHFHLHVFEWDPF